MIFETVRSEGLAHLSYLVGDDDAGLCAVVDPRRDVQVYVDLARRHRARIVAVFETHVHADFVSGGRALAARTGATLHTGPGGGYRFRRSVLQDGGRREIGRWTVEALHCPGHAPEHLCLALGRDPGDPWCVFTGDTLFAGSVGRPDLATDAEPEDLARSLFRSLRERLLPLGDGTIVYPGHGSGSPCGSNIGEREWTTLGWERRANPKLSVDDEEAFVGRVLEDLPDEPAYYRRVKERNGGGDVPASTPPDPPPLPPEAFAEAVEAGALVLDTREVAAYAGGHVDGALHIPFRKAFPVWAGWMLDPRRDVVLLPGDPDHVEPLCRRLFRIGLDGVRGYLRGGMPSWFEAGRPFRRRRDVAIHELYRRLDEARSGDLQLLDVRSPSEWRAGHLPGARHLHAPLVPERLDELDPGLPTVLYCGTGFRSSIAASVLERAGFDRVGSVPGSMEGWRAADLPLVGDGAAGGGRGQ